jgi:hypothetical protein
MRNSVTDINLRIVQLIIKSMLKFLKKERFNFLINHFYQNYGLIQLIIRNNEEFQSFVFEFLSA